MAQELADKIRAAAQAKNIDPDIALAIAKAESSLRPEAKAGTSSAGGLFQVVDKTWKEFGGKPGKKMDADENIRVGTDIIAKNTQTLKTFLNRDPRPAEVYAAHYFGPSGAKTFLSADPATPIVDILGKAAVKANPNLQGKNVGQVLAQLETKMGGPKQPDVSRETPAPAARKPLPPSLPPMAAAEEASVAAPKLASLGPGYQAALALSVLSDTDEKEDRDIDREPGIAEQWLAQQSTRPSVMAQFSDLSIKSPFAAMEPQQPVQMFNDGGEVERLTPQQIERLAEKDVKLTGINKVIDFVAQRVDPKRLPTSARTLLETVQGSRSQITEANFSPEEIDVMRQLAELKGGQKGSINYADYVALTKEMNKQGKAPASMSPSLFSMADPMGNVQTTLGQFRYQRDPKGNLQIIDTYDFNPPNPNAMQEARTGDYGAFGPYGLIRDYAGERIPPGMGREVRIQLPVKRADGGSAELTPEEIEAARRPATVNPNIRRQGEAARRLAAMRDVNTLPDPRTYAAVSGFLGQAPDEMGFSVMHPDAEGIKRAGQAGFGVGTALAVAPVVGGAMKLANIGPSSGGKTTAAQQLGAVKAKGGPFAVEGQTYGSPENFSKPVNSVDNFINTYLADTRDHSLNEWFRNKVGAYVKRDLGTEMDQFVRAADEGRKLHFVQKPITEGYTGPHMPADIRNLRKTEGFPEEGFAKTPYGQKVEMVTDRAVEPVALEDMFPGNVPPSMLQFAESDPTMRVYSLSPMQFDELKFTELRDKMVKMRQMSPEFSKYGQPAVKVPEQYLLTDKSLQGLTPAQASERVVQFDAWKDQAQQKMASRAAFVDPAISRTPSLEGHVWINPPDLERNPMLRELIQDVGCDGGWCTKGENYALSYGSGENRLTVLMDSKARPRAQMTINSKEYGPDDFIESLADDEVVAFRAKYPDIAAYHTDKIAGTPEFRQWRARNPDSFSITEIKGVNNEADLKNAPYVKQIQERVKELDSANELTSVDNLEGIGMAMLPKNENELLTGGIGFADRAPLAKKFGLEMAGLQAVRTEALRLNNWSQYLVGNEDDVVSLVRQATRNVLTPQQRAFGGMIERR